jgi:hypothetical protein
MKNLSLFIVLIVLILFNNSSFCQQDIDDKQVIQYSSGRADLVFKVMDFETGSLITYAEIYSFDAETILATTEIYGIATLPKGVRGVRGVLEVSANNYRNVCFKLESENIDSIVIRLKFRFDHIMSSGYPILSDDSLKKLAEFDANNDIIKGEVFLYFSNELTEEQLMYSKNHSFTFKEWRRGGYSDYKPYYNEVVLNYLSEKFKTDIREELRYYLLEKRLVINHKDYQSAKKYFSNQLILSFTFTNFHMELKRT